MRMDISNNSDLMKMKHYLNDCPLCAKFTWHISCLQDASAKRGMETPDMSSDLWKCSQCMEI